MLTVLKGVTRCKPNEIEKKTEEERERETDTGHQELINSS